ncbi:sigma-54-dependent Fis family transcriptional regulator [Methylomonas paludis]|uniref:Sigma-54-dependent Fis family transcriptional regulator n=1 Tax=Methylomonas paludis TaxID=1173101 RepID=A0A975MQU4_9GAMM|nr:sigma-54 dependent transcriptional regulator [Methylomonas paludis]QWF72353.1 sigma-54-dependent Fis family transcriptional regulator [Methylomonas paludis]
MNKVNNHFFDYTPGQQAEPARVEKPANLLTLPNPHELTTSIRATAQVFEDPKSVALLNRIRMIAPSDANVLVIGETGTGKELIARYVHELSNRKDKPFVAVNCGAFSESLVESELFGHEKGAFTGAFSSKVGWFEAANTGTLFLDEIGDLPLSIQVKLLRVLQEREVVRLGARKPIPINVRLVAATNVRLEEAVLAGHFREDLFYRLRVAHLELPTLRNRPGDIIPLAEYFVSEYRRRLGYNEIRLDEDARNKLIKHSWPGNIRELENVIHHALLICKNNIVRSEDLQLSSIQLQKPRENPGTGSGSDGNSRLNDALYQLFEAGQSGLYDHLEESIIRAAYNYCHNNAAQTAKLLGVSRNIVRARLIKMGAINALR